MHPPLIRLFRPWSSAILLSLLFVSTIGVAWAGGRPLPAVTGPIPVTAESHPFHGSDYQRVPLDLSKFGYVEEEYFVSGKANVYEWPAPGPAVVRTPDVPYTTRILVRRPAHRHRFSGNVMVDMLNPSNFMDLPIGWALSHDHFMRKGDIWVGVTIKPVSVLALKAFDAARYAPLTFANPLPLTDPANCENPIALIAGDTRRETENGLIWDIYSQVGELVRSRSHANPLHKYKVKRVYGFGYSQTGGHLNTYINAIHPLDVQALGKPVYDGYVIGVAGGGFVGLMEINQCSPAPAVGDPRRQIQNVGVPVIRVMSESDYLFGIASRRPDSDTPPDLFRHYEVPGAGHATPAELNFGPSIEDIQAAGLPLPPMSCDQGPRSRYPLGMVFNGVWQNLDLWVRKGIAPPRAEPIEVVNGTPVRDEFGNLRGGVRTPYLNVPTSTWAGASSGAGFCFLVGHEIPFDQTRLDELYRSHGDYVRKVSHSTVGLVRERFLTFADGLKLIVEAAQADVP